MTDQSVLYDSKEVKLQGYDHFYSIMTMKQLMTPLDTGAYSSGLITQLDAGSAAVFSNSMQYLFIQGQNKHFPRFQSPGS